MNQLGNEILTGINHLGGLPLVLHNKDKRIRFSMIGMWKMNIVVFDENENILESHIVEPEACFIEDAMFKIGSIMTVKDYYSALYRQYILVTKNSYSLEVTSQKRKEALSTRVKYKSLINSNYGRSLETQLV